MIVHFEELTEEKKLEIKKLLDAKESMGEVKYLDPESIKTVSPHDRVEIGINSENFM